MHGQSLLYEVDAILHEHHRRLGDRHMAIREEGRSGAAAQGSDGTFWTQWKQRLSEFAGRRRTTRPVSTPEATVESIAGLNQI
ncbi:MAG: hypothetical protein KF883_12850 [Thermomicrobiales bacterium]|nr:hypothetical protein [Thermomicrobiales bacterium]